MVRMRSERMAKGRAVKVKSAKPQTVRDLNLAVIVDLIRRNQPISRAQLAEYAGIHRSNVGIIVEDLQKRGLLREEWAKNTSRGRTPTLISIDRGTLRVLAVNLRHERTTVSLASLDGHVEATYSFATSETAQVFTDEMKAAVTELTRGTMMKGHSSMRISQMVVSIPGIVETAHDKRQKMWTPGLPQFSGLDFGTILEKELGIPCFLANNAGLGAIAALRVAEDDLKDFVFIVIGDVGVGSGVVLHRSLYTGHDAAYAGEIGHSTIDIRGPLCNCGRRGCLQSYICDTATWARYNSKTPFTSVRFEDFLREVSAGSPKALKALKETVSYLGVGISNIVMMLNPERILIAGALTKVWPAVQKKLVSESMFPHHTSVIQPVRTPVDTLFLRGAIETGIDLVLSHHLNRRTGSSAKA